MEHTLPPDLVTTSAAVVAVTGLADGRGVSGPNAAQWERTERALWELLAVRTNVDGTARVPLLLFQKLKRDQGLPAKKVRTAPNTRGILKANWLHKHKVVLPALVVMFFPLDTQDPDWRERDTQAINEIQERRRGLMDRGVRVIVVLVAVSEREDGRATQERVSTLRTACGLDVRTSLFIMSATTVLRDFVINLERIIFEQASAYYREQAKRIKTLKDRLPKGVQYELHVRYCFKIAMYADLRQEPKSAIKYFDAAYNALLELIPYSKAPLRMTEIKMVAEHINYKLCKLSLYTNPREAVGQFQRHVATFIPLTGPESLLHEHWFYIAKQYRIFGELVETALKVGSVTVDQVQHPGFYYQIAATYTGQRKLTQGAMQGSTLDQVLVAEYEKAEHEFVGQPPKLRAHPLEEVDYAIPTSRPMDDEWSSYLAFSCDYESRVDHSALIIELLSRAYEQFKKYKSNRMTLSIAAQIAREYYDVKNYDMALRFFERIAKTYRKEAWTAVLADILTLSLRCAAELNKIESVIDYSLELMSSKLGMPVDYRQNIQNELLRTLQAGAPPVVVDMEHANAVLEVKTQFPDAAQVADRATPFRLLVHLNSALPLRLSSIKITFSSPAQPITLVDNNSQSPLDSALLTATRGSDLVIVPLEAPTRDATTQSLELPTNLFLAPTKVYVFQMPIDTMALRGEIQCAAVTAQLGAAVHPTTLLFRIADRATLVAPTEVAMSWHRVIALHAALEQGNGTQGVHFDDLAEASSLRVLPRKPQLSLHIVHGAASPVLLDEWFPLTIVARNNELREIREVVASIETRQVPGGEPRAYFARDASDLPQGKIMLADLTPNKLGMMQPGTQATWTVHMRCPRAPGDRTIAATVRYRVIAEDGQEEVEETVHAEDTVPVVRAFHVGTGMTLQQSVLFAHQPLLDDFTWSAPARSDLYYLAVAVRIASAPVLRVTSTSFVPATGAEMEKRGASVQVVSSGIEHDGGGSTWRPGQVHNFMFRLKTTTRLSAPDGLLPVGYLQIKWRRVLSGKDEGEDAGAADDDHPAHAFFTVTRVQIFPPERQKSPFNVVADIPPVLRQGEVAPILLTLRNETNRTEEVTVTIDAAEGFLLSGFKQRQMRLLPLTAHPLSFNVYPMQSGSLALPLVRLLLMQRSGVAVAAQPAAPAAPAAAAQAAAPAAAAIAGGQAPAAAAATVAPAPPPSESVHLVGPFMTFVEPATAQVQ